MFQKQSVGNELCIEALDNIDKMIGFYQSNEEKIWLEYF